ncbi:cytochrome-c oxidase [Aggregicoccus sp. 17bor-14]|uniref:cytochrome C oxidase subunit IV family protein n=1 Tax=Myxococcaceae TaxID=31 RepID=UPI00129CC585|nr:MULTISPECIES: cytochrome C oxidase subunit IV family protein [Myxococcaceae]MBF5046506.1 cytochrome C oxidase subunit IV family protein [Simulacricoccus sp. 17bor-14]MRI92222.1 cytochrome-c oxidase [Aggregicoccus sp. 17bor-14]
MSAEAPEKKEAGPGLLLLVGVALLALTTLTYALSHVELGRWAVPVALAIAATKAGLIAAIYMHLHERRGSAPLIAATAVLFVALLAGLASLESATRFEPTRPPGPFRVPPISAHGNEPLPPAAPVPGMPPDPKLSP